MNVHKFDADYNTRKTKMLAYLMIRRLAKLRVESSWRFAMDTKSFSSYYSAHISMSAAAGILWSSGNEPRSKKHSFK